MSDPWQELTDLEHEIKSMTDSLCRTKLKRFPILQEINARSAPALRLPFDVTSEIFIEYLAAIAWDSTPSHRICDTPFLFGKICKAWRDIAWSTPKLWSSLQIDLSKMQKPELIQQWLTRSSTLLLSIRIECHVPISLGPSVQASLHAIALHAERWHNISFLLPIYCYGLLKHAEGRLHNLRYIDIDTQYDNGLMPNPDIFSLAPQLCAARFRTSCIGRFNFPMIQLSQLCLENGYNTRTPSGSVGECLDILRYCPHVTSYTFLGIVSLGHVPQTFSPRLATLQLHVPFYHHQDFLLLIFDALTLPALHTLGCSGSGGLFPYSNFISFLHRSSCTLQVLHLDAFSNGEPELIELLRAVPSIHSLKLTNVPITNDVLHILSCWASSATGVMTFHLLPNLKIFEYVSTQSLDFKVISCFLNHRWNVDASSNMIKLHSAKFDCATTVPSPDDPALALIQRFHKEGMRIILQPTMAMAQLPVNYLVPSTMAFPQLSVNYLVPSFQPWFNPLQPGVPILVR